MTKKNSKINAIVRKARSDDHNFILATYMRSRVCNRHRKNKQKQSIMHDHMQSLLLNGHALVICDPIDDDVLYGYIVIGMDGRVFWGYVSKVWRCNGFFKRLLTECETLFCTQKKTTLGI